MGLAKGSSAALATYRVSIARDFQPAGRIRSPSDPPFASYVVVRERVPQLVRVQIGKPHRRPVLNHLIDAARREPFVPSHSHPSAVRG